MGWIMSSKKVQLIIILMLIFVLSSSVQAVNTIEVVSGEIIEIMLFENSSTGYLWHSKVENNSVLELKSNKKIMASEEKGLAGAPNFSIWYFEAQKSGISKINFALYRSGQPNDIRNEVEYLISVDIPIIELSGSIVKKISLFEESESLNWHLEIRDKDILKLAKHDSSLAEKSSENDYMQLNEYYFVGVKAGYTNVIFRLVDKESGLISERKEYLFKVE